jgi:hypothetical protein
MWPEPLPRPRRLRLSSLTVSPVSCVLPAATLHLAGPMTDARFPERWLNDRRIMKLSAVDFRAFVLSLTWCVSNRTDGRVEQTDLPLVPGFDPGAVAGLVSSGLWKVQPGGWQVVEFAETQTTAAQLRGLDHKRIVDRDRQARKRAHDGGNHSLCLPENCSGAPDLKRDVLRDVTRDATRDTEDRTGQDRQGQPLKKETPELPPEVVSEAVGGHPGFCKGCGTELVGWDFGPRPGLCVRCSTPPLPGEPPVQNPDACSVAGCGRLVTDYLRREYGQVCARHATAVVS